MGTVGTSGIRMEQRRSVEHGLFLGLGEEGEIQVSHRCMALLMAIH